MAFFEYHAPRAREVLCASIDSMVDRFSEGTRECFQASFAEPMAKQHRCGTWRHLPLEKLIDLHDLCARTEPQAGGT